ncbi:MAG: FKBP-type peptidyl-prolyl cis-trans isomerase [Kutzneria sp.]|nr:FKBP-type peptidyl-prolyl cis-trans isomerase [Kutzneria sp.]
MRAAAVGTVVLVSALTAVAGCGAKTPTGSAPCAADDVKVDGAFGTKPTVTIPDTCTPPTQLVIKDLSVGTGPAIKDGDAVDTDYHLVAWSDKTVLDSVWKGGPPQPYLVAPVGQATVIQGWNEGLIGQKQGGRRLLIVPPNKGYGADPPSTQIKPNETLVFVIDAVKVTSATG